MKRTKIFLVVALMFMFSGNMISQNKRALVIGIDKYELQTAEPEKQEDKGIISESKPNTSRGSRGSWGNLDGAVNDAKTMYEILITRFGFKKENILLLTDEQANRESILKSITEHLIDSSAEGDIVFFFYAGHGSQVVNSKSTEPDKKDETIVPSDILLGAKDIRDKELGYLFNQLLDKKVALTAIFDCCHSGSITRGPKIPSTEKTRFLPIDTVDIADAMDIGASPEERGALIITAAQDHQLAGESTDDRGNPHGAFSLGLVDVLKSAPVNESVDYLFLRVKAMMQSNGRNQEPVLAGNTERLKSPLFGSPMEDVSGEIKVPVLRKKSEGQIELQGGTASSVNENCELYSVYDADTVRIKVTEITGLNNCFASIINGDQNKIQPGDLFTVYKWAAPASTNLKVWISVTNQTIDELVSIAGELSSINNVTGIQIVNDLSKEFPTHFVYWNGREWAMSFPDGKIQNLGMKPGKEDILKKLSINNELSTKLFVQYPFPVEQERSIKLGEGTLNNAIEIVKSSAEAHYILVGRDNNGKIEYSWILPNIDFTDTLQIISMPSRTDWIELNKSNTDLAGNKITEQALKLGKLRAWLQLPAPPDEGYFPYRLALKDPTTGKIVTSDNIVRQGEAYGLVLSVDEEKMAKGMEKRYVYVFAIDANGKSTLLYPRKGMGNVENRFPVRPAGESEYPKEIQLGKPILFRVGPPYGVDTFVFLTSAEAIPNPDILDFSGVKTRGEKQGDNPLANLLNEVGSKNRGIVPETPVNWSIDRISIKSRPK
ncbi:MAG: caspase family protein [bacterium]